MGQLTRSTVDPQAGTAKSNFGKSPSLGLVLLNVTS